MPDDYNLLTNAAPAPTLPGTQQYWDDTLRYVPMPAAGLPNPDEDFYPGGFKKTYDTSDFSIVHAPPHGNEESTVAIQDRSWEDPAPLTDVSWQHFPVVPDSSSLDWSHFPAATSGQSMPPAKTIPLMPVGVPRNTIPLTPVAVPRALPVTSPTVPVTSTSIPGVTPSQTPAVTTGPATSNPSSPVLGTYRAMSFGPGDFPGADKATNAVLYGALTDAKGNQVKMTTSDIAMSPNVMEKHGLKLGDYVDVLDKNGNVAYAHQRIADKSYVKSGVPTTDSIELWGRPDIGYAQIRKSY